MPKDHSQITPRNTLELYRKQGMPFDDEQVEMFNKMTVSERLELVFRMMLQFGAHMREIDGKVAGREIPIEAMPPIPKAN